MGRFMIKAKAYFENMSQVLFFRNSYFGLAFLLIALIFEPRLALAGIFASLVGFYFSQSKRTPKVLKDAGLLTINGFFFGIAMASLFRDSAQFYTFLVLGSLAVPMATLAANEILQHWKLSPFIISYILVVWLFWLSARAIALDSTQVELIHSGWAARLIQNQYVVIRFFASVFTGMGRLFFLPNPVFGAALLVLVSAFSPRRGLYFLIGTAIATLAAFLIAQQYAPASDFEQYTYSAGLIGIGLASWPEKFNYKTILLFCLLSVFVTLASIQLFRNLSLPVLSLPYVLTIWLAILSRTPRLNLSWVE